MFGVSNLHFIQFTGWLLFIIAQMWLHVAIKAFMIYVNSDTNLLFQVSLYSELVRIYVQFIYRVFSLKP